MNDDNINGAPRSAGAPLKRTVVVAAAVGVAGLVAGGLATGAISSASAESSTSGAARYGAPQGYGARPPAGQGGDPSKPMRSDEKLLTGSTRTKVIAAVKAKYPDATIQRAETDSDGVYEAHIVNGGTEMVVQVGKSFTITGTQSGHGGGGPGTPEGDHAGDHRPPAPPTGSSSSESSRRS